LRAEGPDKRGRKPEEEDTTMTHATTDQTPRHADQTAHEFDAGFDAFATDEADDALDRQLFAIRESLADFRSL
jgi:hypothetical protein